MLYPLRILKVNKYLIVLTPLVNFVIRSIYKGFIPDITIIDYLKTTNNNKAAYSLIITKKFLAVF